MIHVDRQTSETVAVQAGAIVVATGFDTYQVSEGEFGYGLEGVVTLADFKRMVDEAEGPWSSRAGRSRASSISTA